MIGARTMTMSATKMTARQFLLLGEDPPGVRLELVDGDIIVSPSPAYAHSHTDRQLTIILGNYINEHDLGELVGDVDTIFGNLDVRRPDIIFTAKSRLHLLDADQHGIHFAPDLCAEIVSPGSATMDRVDKFKLYAKHKVPHYWLIDPEAKSFLAYRLAGSKYTLSASATGNEKVKAPPFPALEIPLAKLWLPRRKR
jgi:Uma2 family endonuclease